jgi:hypothetical protein
MDKNSNILSESDWSLHRKGKMDQERHLEKIKKAVKENLSDLVSEESIVMNDGKGKVKIPVRSLEQYRFRYNFGKQEQVGQGDGTAKPGDKLGNAGNPQQGPGQGEGAGEDPGVDYVEAEVSLEEIQDMIFSELELPNLEENKKQDQIQSTHYEFTDIRKKGIMGNIDKKRTILESMKRNFRNNTQSNRLQIHPDDLRFKTWNDKQEPSTNAVVIAMMDTSGSMGLWEKYVARTFFFWTVRFLRTKYKNVEIRFIAHHTEAKEVDEESFFTRGESGGTICSSAYRKALEIIDQDYPPESYNIYAFHFSDGDNLTSDNERCVKLIEELLSKINFFGYGEANQYNRHTTLMSAYKKLEHPKFDFSVIKQKSEILSALKQFFKKRTVK